MPTVFRCCLQFLFPKNVCPTLRQADQIPAKYGVRIRESCVDWFDRLHWFLDPSSINQCLVNLALTQLTFYYSMFCIHSNHWFTGTCILQIKSSSAYDPRTEFRLKSRPWDQTKFTLSGSAAASSSFHSLSCVPTGVKHMRYQKCNHPSLCCSFGLGTTPRRRDRISSFRCGQLCPWHRGITHFRKAELCSYCHVYWRRVKKQKYKKFSPVGTTVGSFEGAL